MHVTCSCCIGARDTFSGHARGPVRSARVEPLHKASDSRVIARFVTSPKNTSVHYGGVWFAAGAGNGAQVRHGAESQGH